MCIGFVVVVDVFLCLFARCLWGKGKPWSHLKSHLMKPVYGQGKGLQNYRADSDCLHNLC